MRGLTARNADAADRFITSDVTNRLYMAREIIEHEEGTNKSLINRAGSMVGWKYQKSQFLLST